MKEEMWIPIQGSSTTGRSTEHSRGDLQERCLEASTRGSVRCEVERVGSFHAARYRALPSRALFQMGTSGAPFVRVAWRQVHRIAGVRHSIRNYVTQCKVLMYNYI